MRQIHIFFALGAVAVLIASGSAFAQEQNADHLFVASTFKMTMPEGGRAAERDSLMEIYHKQVTEKNPLIISQRVMQHFYGSNNHDVVVINEFKNWADIDAASAKDTELFEKFWADQASRRQYNRMMNKYYASHSDEIYTERTKLRK
jgi:hypothetical protein